MKDENLIPELKVMRSLNGNDYSISDWISWKGDIKFAIAYSELFWPEFIEYEDCIILKDRFDEDNFAKWKKVEYVKDYSQIENVLNHIHITDIFPQEAYNEINKAQVKFIGNKMKEMECQIETRFSWENI